MKKALSRQHNLPLQKINHNWKHPERGRSFIITSHSDPITATFFPYYSRWKWNIVHTYSAMSQVIFGGSRLILGNEDGVKLPFFFAGAKLKWEIFTFSVDFSAKIWQKKMKTKKKLLGTSDFFKDHECFYFILFYFIDQWTADFFK